MNRQNTHELLQQLSDSTRKALKNQSLIKAQEHLTQVATIAKENRLPLSEEIHELGSQLAIALSKTKTTRNKKWVEKRLSQLALTVLEIKGTFARDHRYTDEALNTGLFLIDMGHCASALTALSAGYAVLDAAESKAKAAEYVSYLARMAKCHLELGNREEAEVQLNKAYKYFSHLNFEKISEDAYLYEAVAFFMQVDLDLARQAADAGRYRSNLSQFLANTLPGYQLPK